MHEYNMFLSLIAILSYLPFSLLYSCDPLTCKLPSCLCPSPKPPNNMEIKNTPQLIMLTFDDAMTVQTYPAAMSVSNHKNPNGCPIRTTWFLSHTFTDYHIAQQYSSKGNEIADHTVDHLAYTNSSQILVLRDIISKFSNINPSKIVGFRAPSFNINNESLTTLLNNNFLYDCSINLYATNGYVSQGANNLIYPYTLNNGIASSCTAGTCNEDMKYKGLWDIPVYDFFTASGDVLSAMDPPLGPNQTFYDILMQTFSFHYNGNRAPMGIFIHPAYLLGNPNNVIDLNRFIDWTKTLKKDSVWFVSGSQLIDFMKNPQPIGSYRGDSCSPRVMLDEETLCDGRDDNGDGLIDNGVVRNCASTSGFYSVCGYCPAALPTFASPSPEINIGSAKAISSNSIGTQCMPPPSGCNGGIFNPEQCQCECELVHYNALPNTFSSGYCLDSNGVCSIQRLSVLISDQNVEAYNNFINNLPVNDTASPKFIPVFLNKVNPVLNNSIAFLCPTQVSQLLFNSFIIQNVILKASDASVTTPLIPVSIGSTSLPVSNTSSPISKNPTVSPTSLTSTIKPTSNPTSNPTTSSPQIAFRSSATCSSYSLYMVTAVIMLSYCNYYFL